MKSQVTFALVALLPACTLFAGSLVLFSTERTLPSLLQILGAGCLMIVVLAHICEALRLFPSMEWGRERSVGHYLDLGSAVIGLTTFPLGYLLHTLHPRLWRPYRQRRRSA
jgi:succinate dehydrogenase/fumarate reductase cytochrome b subunit